MAKCWGLALALGLAACASVAPQGWETRGDIAFATARAGCRQFPQDSAEWEVCINGFGWRRTLGEPHAGGYDLLRVDLDLTPNLEARTIAARQVITFRAETALREFRFDANALTLTRADLYGDPMTWRTEGDALILTLPHPLTPGEVHAITLAYEGAPVRGLVFDDGVFYTSYFSCDWMFCDLDRPGDPFQFNAIIAGGPLGTFGSPEQVQFPAHVHGFGGGPALNAVRDRVGDVELVYASAHTSEAELRTMLVDTPRMLQFFERAAGVPFPHARYTQLVVREGGPQEGAGFAILGDGALRPILENPHEDWSIAHELAHQWWGNLLTCEDWSEFWLNEGVTTFMVAAWKQQRWGEADYQREIELAQRRWDAAREAGWDRPLAFSGAYPDLRTRRAIQYSKGMLFMVELRRTLGDDAFWRGLGAYTRAHAGGTVESADLHRAMEAASGRDLDALFAAWVYE